MRNGALALACAAVAVVLLLGMDARSGDAPIGREWNVDGVAREALVSAPANITSPGAPLIFDFHGHGGTMGIVARTQPYYRLWPEAIVVYPQGLLTPGRLTDPEGKKPGWQARIGDQGDRDLKFFDAMLASLRKDYRVDEKRIYCTGHSNGGAFTYLLWAARGDQFAAFAPSGAVVADNRTQLKPKPALHIAGEQDPLVKYEWQKITMQAVKKLNQCGEGQPWEKSCTLYPSSIGAPFVTFIHPGGHQFPAEAPALITKFFKEHAKP